MISEEPAVTAPPDRLTAHDDATAATVQEIVDAAEEWLCFHVVGVGAERWVPESHMLRAADEPPPTTQGPQPRICDAARRKPTSQLIGPELRVAATSGEGPNVDDLLCLNRGDQRGKFVLGECPVPDCEDLRRRRRH